MSLEFELPMVCMLFMLMLLIVYFSKEKVKLVENKFFEVILICSMGETVINTITHFLAAIYDFETFNSVFYPSINFFNKIMSILFATIFGCLLCYTLSISYKKFKEKNSLLKISLGVFVVLYSIAAFFTDVTLKKVGYVTTSEGSTLFLSYGVVSVLILANFIITLINYKKLDRRYMVMLYILISIVFFAVISINFPGFIITDLLLVSICYIMFFTIENPDVKMIEQVSLARDNAEKANRAKTDFLSNMSHEVRTPLNAIVGFSECILTEDSLQKAKEDAQDIVMASQNLLEIVNGILDISKIEADKMEIIDVTYNLKKELTELYKLISPRIGEKPIEMKATFAPDIPEYLYGDIGKIKQIVTNILTNAIKYTEKGYITACVNCVNQGNECTLIISVEDTGRGIKPEKIDKIFDKFERLEEDRNTTLEGTGLGLAITKRLAQMLGGKVVCQSKYGEGSKFTIYLKQEITNYHKPEVANTEEETTSVNIEGKKVLVVDDNRINLKVAVRLLEGFKLNIEESESGYDCLQKIKEGHNYDLILMDDMMPGISGTETFHELQKRKVYIPVVALTANAIEGMREKYLEEGFIDYLSKPIDKRELERILYKVLGTKQETKFPTLNDLYNIDIPLQKNDKKE